MSLAQEIRRCQRLEKARLAAWRLEGRACERRAVQPPVRVRRGRERRGIAVSTATNSRGDSDPHIDGAPPVPVGHTGGVEVAYG